MTAPKLTGAQRFLGDFAAYVSAPRPFVKADPDSRVTYPCVGTLGDGKDIDEAPCPYDARTLYSCQQCLACADADARLEITRRENAAMSAADQS